MKSQRLQSQKQRLEYLFNQASRFDGDQLELQGHWAKYICVLVAGFFENALAEVYAMYAKKCANDQVSNYVEAVLGKIQNPKADRFLQTARAFNRDWEQELRSFLEQDGRKDALDSIMSNRHQIAHGKDSGVSLARVKTYFYKGIDVIDFIERQCGLV
jgi:hypothetical protein